MEALIDKVFTDPTLIKVGIVLGILIVLSIFKKLYKAVLILVVVLFLYIAYLAYTGEEIETDKMKKQVEKTLNDTQEKVEDFIDSAKDKIKKK